MDDSKGLSYFLLGLGIGVAVGIVFAPMSGEETRARVRSRALEGGEYLRRRGDELRETAGDLVDRGKTRGEPPAGTVKCCCRGGQAGVSGDDLRSNRIARFAES